MDGIFHFRIVQCIDSINASFLQSSEVYPNHQRSFPGKVGRDGSALSNHQTADRYTAVFLTCLHFYSAIYIFFLFFMSEIFPGAFSKTVTVKIHPCPLSVLNKQSISNQFRISGLLGTRATPDKLYEASLKRKKRSPSAVWETAATPVCLRQSRNVRKINRRRNRKVSHSGGKMLSHIFVLGELLFEMNM